MNNLYLVLVGNVVCLMPRKSHEKYPESRSCNTRLRISKAYACSLGCE